MALCYCCLGDSITSDQVTGIGTVVARKLGAECIDSFMESGFDSAVAKDHGEVHPDEEWKERIACYVAGEIAVRTA